MGILDHFTSIDDLLVELLERIGGVTEEDTHFFSYPNDGTRATITAGTTKLDFMAGTVITPAGIVSNLGNSLRARGREYCRSLSLQADRDIIIQIGTKSKIPVFAGTWFKVAHLRFTDVKIIAAEDTRVFAIACTNPDSIDMAGESYVKDPVDVWGKTTTIGNAELAVRTHSPPVTFERRGDVVQWIDFESATENYYKTFGTATAGRTNECCASGNFCYKVLATSTNFCSVQGYTNDFHIKRLGSRMMFACEDENYASVGVDLRHYDGTSMHRGMVYIQISTGEIYLHAVGPDPHIGTVDFKRSKYNFSTMKVVLDLETDKYVRCWVMGEEFDISDYDMVVVGDGEKPHVMHGAYIHAGTSGGTYYVDNIILTENEPI